MRAGGESAYVALGANLGDRAATFSAVIEAFEKAEAQGSASIQLDGYFIDYPIVYKAQRIVALMERLEGG